MLHRKTTTPSKEDVFIRLLKHLDNFEKNTIFTPHNQSTLILIPVFAMYCISVSKIVLSGSGNISHVKSRRIFKFHTDIGTKSLKTFRVTDYLIKERKKNKQNYEIHQAALHTSLETELIYVPGGCNK